MKRTGLSLILFLACSAIVFGQFKQTPLPYKYSALEPYIDSTTMYIHFNSHHAAYCTNLNKALEKYPELYEKSIVELIQGLNALPADIQTAVRNHGGGFYNHSIFWTMMAPAGTAPMSPKLEKILSESFGSVEAFNLKKLLLRDLVRVWHGSSKSRRVNFVLSPQPIRTVRYYLWPK